MRQRGIGRTDLQNPTNSIGSMTLKVPAKLYPEKPGLHLNDNVIAHLQATRQRPLWWKISFAPLEIEKIFGSGDDGIQALGMFGAVDEA
jgi:hypothetical protein